MTRPQKSTLCYFCWLNISAYSVKEGIIKYQDTKILEAYLEGWLHTLKANLEGWLYHNAVWTMANQIR